MLLYQLLCSVIRTEAIHLPDYISHSFKWLWCTHGASQVSREESRWEHDVRFISCEAGFLVRADKVIKDGLSKWQIYVVFETEVRLYFGHNCTDLN